MSDTEGTALLVILAILGAIAINGVVGCAATQSNLKDLRKEAIDKGHAIYNSDREFEWK